jgi:hypothetical protein
MIICLVDKAQIALLSQAQLFAFLKKIKIKNKIVFQ